MRSAKEKNEIEKTSSGVLELKPINRIATPSIVNAAASGTRLSYFDTNHPEIGKPIIELMGMNNKIVPNSASEKPKDVLMVGIREAQLAKAKPDKK